MSDAKKYSEITHAEWIVFRWTEVTSTMDKEPMFLRGLQRPLDEAMKLSGGSIKTLQPYLWALDKKDE